MRQTAVIVDKDAERRMFMDIDGYKYRLMMSYFNDPTYYTPRYDISDTALATMRNLLALRHIP